MSRSWRRFARLLSATFLVVTQIQPSLEAELASKPGSSVAQLGILTVSVTQPSITPTVQPSQISVPANQNIFPQAAANDNFKIGAGLGAFRNFNPYVLEGLGIFGGAVLGTIEYNEITGQTGIDWSDISDLIKSGDYRPFSSDPNNTPPQVPVTKPTPAPNPVPTTQPVATPRQEAPQSTSQAVGKYPCENFSANAAGKITPDSPKTEEEKKQFEFANPSNPGLSAPNYLYKSGNIPDGARLARAYGGEPKEWNEHRSPGFIVNGRKVYLRWFRLQYSVLDVEYKFVADCSNCPGIITDLSGPVKGESKPNSGNLPEEQRKNFKDGQYIETKTSEWVRLYRAWGGNSSEVGPYWIRDPLPESYLSNPAFVALFRQVFALPPGWGNAMTHVAVRDFPPDTIMFFGKAAKQVENGITYPGGAEQVFLDGKNRARAIKPDPDCLDETEGR